MLSSVNYYYTPVCWRYIYNYSLAGTMVGTGLDYDRKNFVWQKSTTFFFLRLSTVYKETYTVYLNVKIVIINAFYINSKDEYCIEAKKKKKKPLPFPCHSYNFAHAHTATSNLFPTSTFCNTPSKYTLAKYSWLFVSVSTQPLARYIALQNLFFIYQEESFLTGPACKIISRRISVFSSGHTFF